MMDKLIFVGGIHGVGKTHFCKNIGNKLDIPSYSASQIITNKKKVDYSKDKRVDKIEENQDILIEALNQLENKNKGFLLEGHFCLLNKNGQITRIPEDTFFRLQPKAIITLVNSISEISIRLQKRGTDFNNTEFINKFQNEEIIYSEEIANKLKVPYLRVSTAESNENQLNEFLKDLI